MSSRPGHSDEWSYRHRVTDILLTLCGPRSKDLVNEIIDMLGPIDYKVIFYL